MGKLNRVVCTYVHMKEKLYLDYPYEPEERLLCSPGHVEYMRMYLRGAEIGTGYIDVFADSRHFIFKDLLAPSGGRFIECDPSEFERKYREIADIPDNIEIYYDDVTRSYLKDRGVPFA